MALRLTGTSLAPDAPTTGAAGAASAAELAARARAMLAAGQWDEYRGLFARAAEHEDPQRCYQARVMLIEEALAAAGQATSIRHATETFVAAAQATIEALDEQPREPILLNYAGVAMYELWSVDAARELFRAAQRLDPSLPHLRRNLAECKQRQRAAGRPAGRRSLHPALPGLARRARRVAAEAGPATGLRLSLCMIVRDEEEMLPRCLAAVAPAVDEIIIVDTGSRDGTVEIARSFGAHVIEREWTGSFSDARNVSFDAATGDWLMYLDADEILVGEDLEALRSLTGHTWREAFYLAETSYTGDVDDGTAMTHMALRVFRNRPHYRFEGRLHEQIAHNLPTFAPGRVEHTSVRVEHYGYLGAVRNAKEKSRRNIELLRAQMAESTPTPFMHFNLGTEYTGVGDAPAALAEFERAWAMVKSQGQDLRDYAPSLLVRLVNALRNCGRREEAITRAEEGLKLYPEFTDLVFAQGLVSRDMQRQQDAIGYWERCIEMGDAPARYGATVGCGTYLPRISLAELYVRRGEVDRARSLLDWCMRAHPSFVGVVRPYAAALLRSGVDPDAVASEIEHRVAHLTPTVRYMLAAALYQRGAMEAADRQYRAVLESRPSSSQARVALAETLLSRRRYDDAVDAAATIAEDDPFAGLACRIELWSRLAAADLAGARRVLSGRASEAGLTAAERELFAAWATLLANEAEPLRVPIGATPLLGVILEAHLRSHDFKTFETLLPLLESSALPQREQRELLGRMYLSHGFLPFAAKQWMAVCEERPDARAMVGLARVAAAHGQPKNAATFATEALKLDPKNAEASEILACQQPPVPATA